MVSKNEVISNFIFSPVLFSIAKPKGHFSRELGTAESGDVLGLGAPDPVSRVCVTYQLTSDPIDSHTGSLRARMHSGHLSNRCCPHMVRV